MQVYVTHGTADAGNLTLSHFQLHFFISISKKGHQSHQNKTLAHLNNSRKDIHFSAQSAKLILVSECDHVKRIWVQPFSRGNIHSHNIRLTCRDGKHLDQVVDSADSRRGRGGCRKQHQEDSRCTPYITGALTKHRWVIAEQTEPPSVNKREMFVFPLRR